jgi:hypothetical protein
MDLPGRKIIVSRSFHDLPASRGTREANAILRNGKDQFVAETAAAPPRGSIFGWVALPGALLSRNFKMSTMWQSRAFQP